MARPPAKRGSGGEGESPRILKGLLSDARRVERARLGHERTVAVRELLDRRAVVVAALVHHRAVAVAILERSEEHTSELQSLMRISYAVFCLKKKKNNTSQKQKTYS